MCMRGAEDAGLGVPANVAEGVVLGNAMTADDAVFGLVMPGSEMAAGVGVGLAIFACEVETMTLGMVDIAEAIGIVIEASGVEVDGTPVTSVTSCRGT